MPVVNFITSAEIHETPASKIAKFRAKLLATPSGCWEWQGIRNAKGYGRFALNGVMHQAHRIAYVMARGDIPNGLFICHKCDNPPCCNPDHLFAGTGKDNSIDMAAKGRNHRTPGEMNVKAKMTWRLVRQMRAEFATGQWSKKALSRKYGIDSHTARDILLGRRWKEEDHA